MTSSYLDWERRRARFDAELRQNFPGLSARTATALRMTYSYDSDGIRTIKAASDAELLAVRNFGLGALAELRAAWPEPESVPIPEPAPSVPCTAAHGSLSWLGG